MNIRSVAPARPFDGRPSWSFLRLAALVASASFFVSLVPSARAADARPPDLMTYQGFLVDANGVPLASNNPANYPVIFRIYDQATGGNRLWSEQQIVTIDKGNFSVLLGEGTEVPGESRPPLSQVFGGVDASDRYLGITVTISGAPTEILPRLRLLPAPYAYLARHANALVNNNGQPLVAAGTGDNLVVAGSLTANQFSGNGAGLTDLDASKITSGTLNVARIPGLDTSKITTGTLHPDRIPGLDAAKITSGTLADARLGANLARRDQANIFIFDNQIYGNLWMGSLGNAPTTGAGYGRAVVFSGGPDVSPTWNNDNSDPLWIARYNVAENQSQLRINIGDDPGGGDALVIGTTSGGGADFNQTGTWTTRASIDSAGNLSLAGGIWVSSMPFGDYRNVQWNDATGRLGYDNSSRRFKENITPLRDDFALLLKAQPMTYTRPGDPDRWEIGYIAEDFHALGLTRLVDYDREGRPDGINYEKICLYLNENAKAQAHELAELKAEYQTQVAVIAAQRAELEALKTRLASLEQLLRQMAQNSGAAQPQTAAQTAASETAGN
ncbi:tail fiber domain-containing protein [Limisphaera sp. VF-2]|uniref:tail fiber domain-containing protein n=1 Tax=Limisphaera sp. VF-2 TaxID=3400418 RepID=UPI003C13C887